MFMRIALICIACWSITGCDNLASWSYEKGIQAERDRAGLVSKRLTTDDGIDWFYLESKATQDLPVVFLIHGFGADSSNWVRFANELEGNYHFIIPDLPGHGDTTRTLELDYHVRVQAQRILALADALGIDKFHVAGSSMGGAISIALAFEAPERLLSMGLVDAAGVTLVTPEFAELLAQGDNSNPLIPHTPEDMFVTMDWAMADPPWLPDFFVTQMGKLKAENSAVAEKVHAGINNQMNFVNQLHTIQTPTLIVWGKLDRLLTVDNVPVFDREIPNSEAVIFDTLGHLPMAESPSDTAEVFAEFWSRADSAG